MKASGSPEPRIRVLVVEPADGGGPDLQTQLDGHGTNVVVSTATELEGARARLTRERVDCVLCLHDPPAVDGIAVLQALRDESPDLPVLVATDPEHADAVLSAGATDVVTLLDGGIHRDVVANRIESIVSGNRERSTYERVFETTTDGIAVHDPGTGEIVDANGQFASLFGLGTDGPTDRTDADGAASDPTVSDVAGAVEGLTDEALREFVVGAGADGARTVEWRVPTAGADRKLEVRFESATVGGGERVLAFARDVTDRRERERARDVLDALSVASPDYAFVYDADGRYLDALTGIRSDEALYSEAELLDATVEDLLGESAASTILDGIDEVLSTGETVTVEYPMPEAANGRWFEGTIAPLPEPYDGREAVLLVARDVTDRKEREQVVDDLLDATATFHRVGTVEEFAEALMDAAEEVFGYEFSVVRLHDPETGTLPPSYVSRAAADIPGEFPTYADDTGVVGEAFQSGESTVIADLSRETTTDYGPFESAVVVPLGRHGTLAVGAREPAAFADDDAALVELLALAATGALDRLDRAREMRRLERIVDHVDEMVFLLDEAGRFTFVTDQFASYLDRDPETLGDTPLSEVVRPGDVADFEAAFHEVRDADGDERRTVEVAVGTDRGARPVELELSTMSGADEGTQIAGVAHDISELTETRGRLATERDRFQELFENVSDPVVELAFADGRPVVEYANPAFAEVFGFDTESVVGENLNTLVVPDGERSSARDLDDQVRAGTQLSVEVQRETTDGPRDFLLRAIPYERDGGTYAFAIYTDITDQKERERYLQVLNRVLRHNIRNDMNVVMGIGEQLADDLDGELETRTRTLLKNARAVAALGEKAREIERIVSAHGGTDVINVVWPVRDVVDEQRARFPQASVTVDLPPELSVRGRPDLRRAVEELVENALQHGGRAPTLHIDGTVVEERGTVELRFSDDGPGIPDEEWQVVAGQTEITQLNHGSGLGLWLVRWIVTSCGGTVRREPVEAGTTIVVELVLADEHHADGDGDEHRAGRQEDGDRGENPTTDETS